MPVHPHVRGEQACKKVDTLERAGSSPRAWGTDQKNVLENIQFSKNFQSYRILALLFTIFRVFQG